MPSMLDPITQRHVERAADALFGEFTGVFGRETIERYIMESLDLLGAPRFTDFLPVLAHRFARQRLRALGQADGTIVKELPEVLFVCVQNAGRSQMAAGLLRLRSEDRIHVRSAGSAPADEVNPLVLQAMAEVGVDMGEAFPKPLTEGGRAGGRRGDHDGVRRRVSDLPGEALRGLGARRPRKKRPRGHPPDQGRDRRADSASSWTSCVLGRTIERAEDEKREATAGRLPLSVRGS